jgi:molybdate transport system regulatory protein
MELKSNVWLTNTQQGHFGKGRIELLVFVDQLGSISKAAKAMRMSYKAAWDAVNEMNTLSDTPIVERATGGRGGGGTRLTERGREIIAIFQRVEAAQEAFSATLGHYADDIDKLRAFTSKFTVRTSARNQWRGTISALEISASRVDVEVTVATGVHMVVQITPQSCDELDLARDSDVTVLFKPTWVRVFAEDCSETMLNCMEGTIQALEDRGTHCEIKIAVAETVHSIAIVPCEERERLGLEPNAHVWFQIDPSAALLAV